MLIILLFLPLTFFENSFDKKAGALRFVEICFSQLLDEKFSILSFSNNEALFIKQSKNFIFDFENLIILMISFSLLRSPLIK